MRRFTVAVATCVGLLTAPCIGTAAPITYAIQNYPADQNGATLSGTITTDGTIGELMDSNVLSWSWTITPTGGTPFTLSSVDVGSGFGITGTGVSASTSEITIASPISQGFLNDMVFTGIDAAGLFYDRFVGAGTYYGSVPNTIPVWNTGNPAMGGTDPWVIAVASVPEPSTLTLAGLGVVSVLAFGLARRRRAGSNVV
ncbi:MAG: PEP-CTERM sorting domain-containing protein [Isosphaeraceae bacterium]